MLRNPRHIGVLLAAGRGSRMNGTKQLTPWPTSSGHKPLVCAAYDSIRPVCDNMVVVLGHQASAIASALAARRYELAECDPDLPMFESIRAGLRVAHTIDADAFVVLQPGDHPQVDKATLDELTTWSFQRTAKAIIPVFAAHGGHPVIIPPGIVTQLLEADCPAGLGQFWLDHPELCHRVAVADPFVVRDIDTPADLE